jgi:hypothetical protein
VNSAHYFQLGPVRGSPHTRYAVLNGHTVVEILVSRPDGIEIERPTEYRIKLRPFVGGPIAAGAFNNVRGASAEAARQRAGVKGARAMAERRSLMPGIETDAKLALARQRGAFRRAA